jgi:hypothetical protein
MGVAIAQRINDRGDAGRQLGVIGVTDADAGDIGEQIFHRVLPAGRR